MKKKLKKLVSVAIALTIMVSLPATTFASDEGFRAKKVIQDAVKSVGMDADVTQLDSGKRCHVF